MAREEDLRAALEKHLAATPGRPPVVYEDVSADLGKQLHYEAVLLPAESETVGRDSEGTEVLMGIYQVMICVPKASGRKATTAEIGRLTAHFSKALVIEEGCIRVAIHKVWSNPAIADTSFHRTPVSIRYRGL